MWSSQSCLEFEEFRILQKGDYLLFLSGYNPNPNCYFWVVIIQIIVGFTFNFGIFVEGNAWYWQNERSEQGCRYLLPGHPVAGHHPSFYRYSTGNGKRCRRRGDRDYRNNFWGFNAANSQCWVKIKKNCSVLIHTHHSTREKNKMLHLTRLFRYLCLL